MWGVWNHKKGQSFTNFVTCYLRCREYAPAPWYSPLSFYSASSCLHSIWKSSPLLSHFPSLITHTLCWRSPSLQTTCRQEESHFSASAQAQMNARGFLRKAVLILKSAQLKAHSSGGGEGTHVTFLPAKSLEVFHLHS